MADNGEDGRLDDAGIERAVAEVQGVMDRIDADLVQAPRNPLTSPFGPEKVDVPFHVRRILMAYFGRTAD